MKTLEVYYKGWGERWLLGTLADNGQALLFEYSPQALARNLELSPRHLKLRPEAYGGFPDYLLRLPGLLADCLPDGWGMLLMDRLFRQAGRSASNLSPLDRLAFIGSRAMGALTFQPADELALTREDATLLELASQIRAVVSGQDGDALLELAVTGGSPHGARPKALVNYRPDSGEISTGPLAGSAPWLVKFQAQGEHKEACAVEQAYAALARACGLDMPQTRYFDLAPRLAAFGVIRFDREHDLRVPMQTLAGLLHANFRLPSSVDYTTFLRATRMLTRDEREVQKAFERAVFNVLFNNRDDHSKNFSYCLDAGGNWKLSPCYDLTFNEGPGGEHQMDVVGHGTRITRAQLLTLAQQGGLERTWASATIARLREQAPEFRQLAAELPVRKTTLRQLSSRIEANQRLLGEG